MKNINNKKSFNKKNIKIKFIILILTLIITTIFMFSFFKSLNNTNKLNKNNSFRLEEIKKEYDFIVDVRELNEWNSGHLKDSIFIPLSKIENDFLNTEFGNGKINKEANILLVCRSGNRAGIVKSILEKNGFTKIKNGGSWLEYK